MTPNLTAFRMRNQLSALSQVCTTTAEKKQRLEDTGRGKSMKIWKKKESREERKAKRTDLNGCSVVRRGN